MTLFLVLYHPFGVCIFILIFAIIMSSLWDLYNPVEVSLLFGDSAEECFHGDLTTLCKHILIKVVKSIITPPKNIYTSESRKSTGDSDMGKKANPGGVILL